MSKTTFLRIVPFALFILFCNVSFAQSNSRLNTDVAWLNAANVRARLRGYV